MSSMQIGSCNEYKEASSINQHRVSLSLYKCLQKLLLEYCGIVLRMLHRKGRAADETISINAMAGSWQGQGEAISTAVLLQGQG